MDYSREDLMPIIDALNKTGDNLEGLTENEWSSIKKVLEADNEKELDQLIGGIFDLYEENNKQPSSGAPSVLIMSLDLNEPVMDVLDCALPRERLVSLISIDGIEEKHIKILEDLGCPKLEGLFKEALAMRTPTPNSPSDQKKKATFDVPAVK